MLDVPILLFAVAVAASIAVLSLLPGDSRMMSLVPPTLHRAGHVSAYATLGCLCVLVLQPLVSTTFPPLLAGFLIATGFGVIMEYLQKLRPGRAPSVGDAAVNAAGAALGVLVALGWLASRG